MKYVLMFFLCFSTYVSSKAYEYDLAVCAIFRDDAKYLPEWIDFHKSQGVEHFYLYDNLSQDDFRNVLATYIKSGLVEIIPWHLEQNNIYEWNSIQCSAYMDCVERTRECCRWVAFIDTDEFLFCPKGYDLGALLWFYRVYGGVSVNWVMYGTSDVQRLLPGERMLDKLVYRGPLHSEVNKHVKTIVQPRYVVGCVNPHYFLYEHGKHAVTEKKKFIDGPFSKHNSVEMFRINHYWQRDLEFFRTVKTERQKKWGNTNEGVLKECECRFNDEYDPILAKRSK